MSKSERDSVVNILLVDDRPANLVALKAMLDSPDYRLITAESGEEALAEVLRRPIAVVLMDVAMPGMDGYEVVSLMKGRSQSRDIPVIFVTAQACSMEHVFRGYAVGAVDYIRKPLDLYVVRAKVKVFADLYRQRLRIEAQASRLCQFEMATQRQVLHNTEQALQRSETLHQLIFDSAPIGIGHANADGVWTRVNPHLAEILGVHPGDLVGHAVTDMATGQEHDALENCVLHVKEGLKRYTGEHALETVQGLPLWAEISLARLTEPGSGVLTHIIVVVRDLTDHHRCEVERERLAHEEEAVRIRDQFLSLAAHELRTPLTPLRLKTTRLLHEVETPSGKSLSRVRLVPRLQAIDRAALRLERLTEQLLCEARIGGDHLCLQVEDVDLGETVQRVIARMHDDGQQTERITVQSQARAVGRWDGPLLERVIANLLTNALKYGGDAPVTVNVESIGEMARLSVHDRGMGISEADQERIFERFERVASSRSFGGFGLGLWIARRIVEAHNGHIEVISQPGAGAEFRVSLPWEPEVAETNRSLKRLEDVLNPQGAVDERGAAPTPTMTSP